MSDDAQAQRLEEAAEYYRGLVRSVFSGRKLILIGGPVVGLTGIGQQLRALGADRPFLLGTTIGTGELPKADEAEWHSLDVRGDNVIHAFRQYEALLGNLPDDVRRALDRYDPDRSALVVGLILLGDVPEVAGRRRYAAPSISWGAFEDKAQVDELWDAIGVRRAPSKVIPVHGEALRAASRRLDRGMGTAWAGDATEGTNGGAVYLRWVRTEEDAREAEAFFQARCERVRVMPFLEGIPCSIHGVVLPETVAAFRPCELVTLRRRGQARLCYAGAATFWDPPPPDREEMRSIARRTGAALRERVGYRGPFTIDGVMTEEGFLPTELNARFGAGLGILARSVPSLPLAPTLLAVQAGETFDFRPELLEGVVVEGADARRGGGGWLAIEKPLTKARMHPIVEQGDRYRLARPNEKADGVLSLGPGDMGGFVHFGPDPARVPVGASVAPRVIRALALADEEWDTGIGLLDPPREVR